VTKGKADGDTGELNYARIQVKIATVHQFVSISSILISYLVIPW